MTLHRIADATQTMNEQVWVQEAGGQNISQQVGKQARSLGSDPEWIVVFLIVLCKNQSYKSANFWNKKIENQNRPSNIKNKTNNRGQGTVRPDFITIEGKIENT
jgi:hypothetical protein